MIRAISVDNDVNSSNELREMIEEMAKDLEMEIEVESVNEPQKCLEKTGMFDIYFLGIEMPGMSGIELAKQLRQKYIDKEIVFVSAHSEYMRTCMYVRPRAFVRKEHMREDLEETMAVLKQVFDNREAVVPVKDNRGYVRVKPGNTLYLKSDGHYVTIHDVSGNRIIVRNTLKVLEAQMRKYDIVRVHLRYLVNLNYVEKFFRHKITLRNGESMMVSAPYEESVAELIENRALSAEG